MSAHAVDHRIPVIDLFAGPGGLGEGFAEARDSSRKRMFRVALSVEKDENAHRTLRLRSFYRQFRRRVPEAYYECLRGRITIEDLYNRFPVQASASDREAVCGELGGKGLPHDVLKGMIKGVLGRSEAWVLIGGPPCQAYSIAGRSRNRGIEGYRLEGDERHRLYQEYLRIVADHRPPVFVMENVKGLLSTTVRDRRLFERMHDDLSNPGYSLGRSRGPRYRILSLEERETEALFEETGPRNFVVRMERHGVPQCRHRVILLGVRSDLGEIWPSPLPRTEPIPAKRVLNGLPALRSGLSQIEGRRVVDSPEAWLGLLQQAKHSRWVSGNASIESRDRVRRLIKSTLGQLQLPEHDTGSEFVPGQIGIDYEPSWFLDDRIGGACNHSTRLHMERDLYRYMFVACFGQVNGRSPRLRDFPPDLLPNHKNVPLSLNGGLFNDRFRVQLADLPATTITSHIHKDGHYYIHPDPAQCRALTVREAARLQTFPDGYYFCGPRTKQYVQVGNAVPPLLAKSIAKIVLDLLRHSGLTE